MSERRGEKAKIKIKKLNKKLFYLGDDKAMWQKGRTKSDTKAHLLQPKTMKNNSKTKGRPGQRLSRVCVLVLFLGC